MNNQFCIAGGRDGGHANFFWKNVAQTVCFDFASGSWQVKADIPSPRAGSSYGRTCDGKLVVAGGEGFGKAFNRVDVFNGFGWESGGSLVQARHGSGVAVSGNCQSKTMFVASGSGAQGMNYLCSAALSCLSSAMAMILTRLFGSIFSFALLLYDCQVVCCGLSVSSCCWIPDEQSFYGCCPVSCFFLFLSVEILTHCVVRHSSLSALQARQN